MHGALRRHRAGPVEGGQDLVAGAERLDAAMGHHHHLVDRGERQLPICPQFVGTGLTVPKGSMLRLDRDDAGRLTLRLDA